jgi:hypothetical protein
MTAIPRNGSKIVKYNSKKFYNIVPWLFFASDKGLKLEQKSFDMIGHIYSKMTTIKACHDIQ